MPPVPVPPRGGGVPAPRPPRGAGKGSTRTPLERVDETSAGGLVLDRLGVGSRGALIGRLDRRGRLLWSLPKGHVETGETEPETAVREVAEETGITARLVTPAPIHVDVHEGGRGHLHLDVRYLLLAPRGARPAPPPGESQDVEWLPSDVAMARSDLSAGEAITRALTSLEGRGPVD
jgi:8-oxo-dGTP pyrophosphatase MutT (NUDIX family)